ncbi:MAG: RidA family protein [Deltaproteobacteria bacterium]|nr:RidA family protein [Deltaproteobacteria bacterium]
MKKLIHSDHAPRALGPYSQAVQHGDLVFLSGQVGIDPATGKFIDGGVEEQTHQVIKNLTAVLEAADLDRSQILKTTIFLASMEDFQKVNAVYGEYFSDNPPARATVEVAGLPLGALVEVEAVAAK